MDEEEWTRDGERFEFRELNGLQFRIEHGCQGGKIYVLVEDYRSTFKSERLAILERVLPEQDSLQARQVYSLLFC